MLAYNVIAPTVGKGTIVLTVIGSAMFQVVGCSVPMSVSPGFQGSSFTICPEKGKPGVLALVVDNGSKRAPFSEFLLFFSWEDEKPFIDLRRPFVCSSTCLGQIVDHFRLEVIMRDQTFTSGLSLSGKRYVTDANLMCRVIAGQATYEELDAAASEYVEEASARDRLPKLIAQMEEERQEFSERHQIVKTEAQRTSEELRKYRSIVSVRQEAIELLLSQVNFVTQQGLWKRKSRIAKAKKNLQSNLDELKNKEERILTRKRT